MLTIARTDSADHQVLPSLGQLRKDLCLFASKVSACSLPFCGWCKLKGACHLDV